MHLWSHLSSQPLTIPAPQVLFCIGWSIPLVPHWVIASHFLKGNMEPELKHTIFSSLLFFHVFLSFLFFINPLSILLIPSNPLRMSICKALILNLSLSFHNIVSLPYIRRGTSNVSCKTLAHSSCKSLALTRDLMAPQTLLPFTTFLLHSTLPRLYQIHPKHNQNI